MNLRKKLRIVYKKIEFKRLNLIGNLNFIFIVREFKKKKVLFMNF